MSHAFSGSRSQRRSRWRLLYIISGIEIVVPGALYLLLLALVNETISSVEDAQVVDVLHVSLLELCVDTILFANEMQSVEGFGLGFSDRWNVFTAWERTETHEVPAAVLQRDALGSLVCGGQEVQKRSFRPLLISFLETALGLAMLLDHAERSP